MRFDYGMGNLHKYTIYKSTQKGGRKHILGWFQSKVTKKKYLHSESYAYLGTGYAVAYAELLGT